MKKIMIKTCPGFSEWRDEARLCLAQNIAPEYTIWQNQSTDSTDMFEWNSAEPSKSLSSFSVPRAFLDLASFAACYIAPERFSLLYRILWRLKNENPHLLSFKTDNDILALEKMVKAVRRDAYKIKAFLRFRQMNACPENTFVAWYEPEHYSLELSLPFFQTRFKNMAWSILTPYRAAHWDRTTLILSDNPDPSIVPAQDKIENYWLTYYASTFNPARPKKSAMLNQMPKKYWKNMPETVLIENLLRTSEARARAMIEKSHSAPKISTSSDHHL